MSKAKKSDVPADDAVLKFVCPSCDAHTTMTVADIKERRAASATYVPICEVDQHPLKVVGQGEAPAPAPKVESSPADEHEFVLGVLERHSVVVEKQSFAADVKRHLKDVNEDLKIAQDALNIFIARHRNPVSTPLLDGVESLELDDDDDDEAPAAATEAAE